MRFVIVTGVSGAGKTAALKMLEDANYFCVDNLPIPLLEKFASLMPEIHGEDVQNVALGIDARSGRSLDELEAVLDRMKKAGYEFEILFLDAEDSVLVKRYKETRRSHPLAMGGRVDDGIRLEREKMQFLKKRADYIIDTSHLLTRELKQEIERIFVANQDFCNMMVSVLSFGFKYGIPADADLVFDVRFLPNPYYVDELRPMTGMDDGVFNYVMNCDTARKFADKLEDMINFLIPNYVKEGKTNLVCFKIDGEMLEVTSNSETGDMEEKMQVSTEGKDLTIAFNVRYITDVLKALSDEQIVMRFNSNVSPCVICPVEGESYLYLVLPVRVFNA